MIKTIFFDRDGVINEVIPRESGVSSPRQFSEFRLRQEFIDFYNLIASLHLNLFVVSNQPDIERALLAEQDLEKMDQCMLEHFDFKEILYCKHNDAANCPSRKPKPGMLEELIVRHKIERNSAIVIGDSWKDVAAGAAAAVRTVYLSNTYNRIVDCSPDIIIEKLPELIQPGWLEVEG